MSQQPYSMYLEKTVIQKEAPPPVSTAALLTIAGARTKPEVSIDRGTDTGDVPIYNGVLLSRKQGTKLPFAETRANLETVTQSEIRQKEQNTVQYHFYAESKQTAEMNLLAKQKQNHRCKKRTFGYQRRGCVNREVQTGTDIYTLLCIQQTTHENLLLSTGDSAPCSAAT